MTILLSTAALTLALPATGRAQGAVDRVVVLPPATSEVEDGFADDLYVAIREGTRVYPTQQLVPAEETARLLERYQVRRILGSRDVLREFAEQAEARFIVGAVAARNGDGLIEVSLMLYSLEEHEIKDVRIGTWAETETIAGTRALARELTHPRNYSPADTSFFYSLLIPGLGQLQQGAVVHAVASAGLVAGAIVYGATAPQPDNFRLKWERFQAQRIPGTNEYNYIIDGQIRPEAEFYEILSDARRHNIAAERSRQISDRRQKRAGRLLVGAYILNLIDTLFLTRHTVDTRSFFLNLEALPAADRTGAGGMPGVRLRLVVPLGRPAARAPGAPGGDQRFSTIGEEHWR